MQLHENFKDRFHTGNEFAIIISCHFFIAYALICFGQLFSFFKSGLECDGNLNKQTFNYIQKLNTYFFMNNLKLFSTLFSAIEFLYNIGVLTVTKVNLP